MTRVLVHMIATVVIVLPASAHASGARLLWVRYDWTTSDNPRRPDVLAIRAFDSLEACEKTVPEASRLSLGYFGPRFQTTQTFPNRGMLRFVGPKDPDLPKEDALDVEASCCPLGFTPSPR